MLDWEGLFKRYVWDSRTTPYLVAVTKLNRHQADYEILAYCLFNGVLFAVVAVAALSEAMPFGRSPAIGLYAFTVVCAAVIFHFTKVLPAAIVVAGAPLACLAFIAVYGFGSARPVTDTMIVAVMVLALIAYSIRIVKVAYLYPSLPDGEGAPPRRRLFK
jgi:hypothetical protein